MSEEFEDRKYTAFWPILIFMVAFALSCFYQLYEVVEQHSALIKRADAAEVNVGAAKRVAERFVTLVNALVATSKTDPNATKIIQEAIQAGIIREKPAATNSTANPAPPASK
jgi:hypothetical protein